MREYIDIKLVTDVCVRKQQKRASVISRCFKNFGIQSLVFKDNDYSFSVFLENGKICFDKQDYIAKMYGVHNIEETDEKLKQIAKSNVLEIENILPLSLANSIHEEIEQLKTIKQYLQSMLMDEEILNTLQQPKPISLKKYKTGFMEQITEATKKVENSYTLLLRNAQKNNLSINNLIRQIDNFYNNGLRNNLLKTYIKIKNELNEPNKKELTDEFVIETIQMEKLLYISLVSAYKNKNYEYLDKKIKKLTKGRISTLTAQIIKRYNGSNIEFLESMKEFELAYGLSSVKKDDLLVDGAKINAFNYNFLSLENKQEVDKTIKQMIEEASRNYQKTQNDRYLVLIEKLQVVKELDIKELYIGKNSFEGYIGYQEENSNIMLEKYYDDALNKVPAINEACYVVDKEDFELMAMHNKEEVIQMIKNKTIRAKRFYHDNKENTSCKKLFKEKVITAMRSKL